MRVRGLLRFGLRPQRQQPLGADAGYVENGLILGDVLQDRRDGLEFPEVVVFGHFLHAFQILFERKRLVATKVLQVAGELHS